MDKIIPIKHVWECHWCNEYISKSRNPNVFYDPLYGEELYDPNHVEYSKVIKQYVCDGCWYRSLYISITNEREDVPYGIEEHI